MGSYIALVDGKPGHEGEGKESGLAGARVSTGFTSHLVWETSPNLHRSDWRMELHHPHITNKKQKNKKNQVLALPPAPLLGVWFGG